MRKWSGKSGYKKFHIWRYKHITHQQFLSLLAAVIGFASGMGVVLLKNLTHYIAEILKTGKLHPYHYYFTLPFIGLLLVVLVKKYLIKTEVWHGIPMALYALARKNGIMDRKTMFSSVLTAPLTVGFGGSTGLEGPAVATGASLGANISQFFHLDEKSRKLLLTCAAGASLSAIFKAPIAAIVFCIEIFSLDLTLVSLMPLLIASVTAVITRLFFLGGEYLMKFYDIQNFSLENIPFYLLLGVVTAFFSVYFSKVYFATEKWFGRYKNPFVRIAIAGLLLGFLIYAIPPLYGEGFQMMNNLIGLNYRAFFEHFFFPAYTSNRWVVTILMLGLILAKPFATSATLHGGGVGGIFAPVLFTGTVTGNLFAKFFDNLGVMLPSSNFTLVGMAGLMAGVLHAPLTAIFLIAEVTGGYELFVPLMITVAISFTLARLYSKHSVYTKELAEKDSLLTHDKDQTILTAMALKNLIERNFVSVQVEENLGDLVSAVSRSSRNLFPVLDDDKHLVGIITLDTIRSIMFDITKYEDVKVSDLMQRPPELIFSDDRMKVTMDKFERSSAWNLPVVNHQEEYVGFISKSKLLTAYRRKLLAVSTA